MEKKTVGVAHPTIPGLEFAEEKNRRLTFGALPIEQ